MRVVTLVSLGASAVLGLGALVVAKVVLPENGAEAAPRQKGVPVVIAAKDLTYGAKLDATMLTVADVPANLAPQGAFATVAQVLAADKGGAPVVLFPIAAREPLLPAKLSGPGSRPTVAAQIAEGMRAYTIEVSDVSGVGGHALPGDRVDVVLMRDLTPDGDVRNFVSQVVLQNVRVLGVDLNADLASSKPASPSTATLEVSVEDAQKLSVASELGELSLALRRTGGAELEQAALLRTHDFLLGAPRPAVRVSSGPRVAAPRPAGFMVVEGATEGGKRRSAKRTGGPKTIPSTTPAAAPTAAPAAPAAAPAPAKA